MHADAVPTVDTAKLEKSSNVVDDAEDSDYSERLITLKSILDGNAATRIMLDFLCSHNQTDQLLLQKLKDGIGTRSSVLHNACITAHAFMNCGTTHDVFLRNNLEWLGKATDWAKFTAIGGLGVVHKGHLSESLTLLKPYLPQVGGGSVTTDPFSEGGALYALGLIHANKGWTDGGKIVDYLTNAQNNTRDPTVLHGACLGLGCAAMASGSTSIYSNLKDILYSVSDNLVVAGEAAALGIGLIFVGHGNKVSNEIQELLTHAHDTKHEKIIRGLAMALALTMYAQEEVANTLIEQLLRDKDHILRYGGCFTIGMAFCGTSNNTAIKRLLRVAVTDVNKDVRRSAVMCLGFVLFRSPELVPDLVKVLSTSYCSHVRYGACLAIGIACAGTALPSALKLLNRLVKDKVDYVRQGAMLALSMVLIQETEAAEPILKGFRESLTKVIPDKHQPTMAKMGAVLATGILNAGGCNTTITLASNAGFKRLSAVVGMALFLQHWYWYPMAHFLSFSFTPTGIIGINKNMKMPKGFSLKCNARPSLFAYPEKLKVEVEAEKKRIETVALSTTAKEKARQKKKDRDAGVDTNTSETSEESKDDMEVDTSKSVDSKTEKKEEEKKEEEKKEKEKVDETPEPEFFDVSNPQRITRRQQSFISIPSGQRYTPVLKNSCRNLGIVVLSDGTPDVEEDLVVVKPLSIGAAEDKDEGIEPEPPADFFWTPAI